MLQPPIGAACLVEAAVNVRTLMTEPDESGGYLI